MSRFIEHEGVTLSISNWAKRLGMNYKKLCTSLYRGHSLASIIQGVDLRVKHGQANSGPEYRAWKSMKRRCENPSTLDYPLYGARGIKVCERWTDYANFLSDMGPRPSLSHTLDRINVEGNYEPSNCRWATNKQQQRNRRDNHLLTLGGKTQCLSAWEEELGISSTTIRSRIKAGMTDEEALTTPIRRG